MSKTWLLCHTEDLFSFWALNCSFLRLEISELELGYIENMNGTIHVSSTMKIVSLDVKFFISCISLYSAMEISGGRELQDRRSTIWCQNYTVTKLY